MRPLLRRAKELDAHLHIDMESLDAFETTMELVHELLDEPEFRDGPVRRGSCSRPTCASRPPSSTG